MGNMQCAELLRTFNFGNNNIQTEEESHQINTMSDTLKVTMPQRLKVEDTINISGIIADTDIFSIALVAEHFDNGEPDVVPYHFKVLFDEGRAVTNIKLGGTWRNEIDVEYPPLEKGGPFSINIKINTVGYMTRVNNEYWRQDPHVINGTIKSLEIWKGLGKLQSIGLDFGD